MVHFFFVFQSKISCKLAHFQPIITLKFLQFSSLYARTILIALTLQFVLFITTDPLFAANPLFNQSEFFGNGAVAIAVGDMDGDGDLDIITGNADNQNVVYLNDGGGKFTYSENFGTGSDQTNSVAVGDMDGDGDLDIITGNEYKQNVVYLNDGGGKFAYSENFGTGSDRTTSIAVGDMDGDSDLDIVIGTVNTQNIIYLNNGEGKFTPGQNFDVESSETRSIVIGDMDGDGDLDIVVGKGNTQNVAYLNDGKGKFIPGQNFGIAGDQTSSMAVGDVDGDGDLDIVVGNSDFIESGQQNRVYLNDGDGNLTHSQDFGIKFGETLSIAVGDMDGDGDLDIVTGNSGIKGSYNQQDAVYFNDGRGIFTPGQYLDTGSFRTMGVAISDMDSDGDLDIVVGNYGQHNGVYLNDGGGRIIPGQNPGTWNNRIQSMAMGDMDQDGDLDIVAGNYGQPNVIYLNDGGGVFTAGQDFGTGDNQGYSVAVGDMDGDGDLDIIVGNEYQQNAVYLNDSTGSFTPGQNFGTEIDRTYNIAVGDIDGDGDLDIVAGNYGQPNVIYLNNGGGMFIAGQNFGTASGGTQSVAVGDMDGDGDLDIIVGNGYQQNAVYLNDSTGSFTPGQNFGPESGSANSIAVGDIDGDGDLDIVAGNYGQPNVIYLNNGGGVFTAGQNFGTASGGTQSVAVGDMEGDGDLDIVVQNSRQQNEIFLNDGAGTFTYTQNLIGRNGAGGIVVGDIDRDNDLDIVTNNYINSTPQIEVYLNNVSVHTLVVSRPVATANASFYSTPERIEKKTIDLRYLFLSSKEQLIGKVRVCYSLNGVGKWQLAVTKGGVAPAPQEIVYPSHGCPYIHTWEQNAPPKPTLSTGTPYTFTWDTFASGFFGQSDNVVFRIEVYPNLYPVRNGVPGPFQHPYVSSTTFPFRVRGTQVQVVDEAGKPASDAQVYRLRDGQSQDGTLFGNGSITFHTNAHGYLQGRGEIGIGDQLLAMAPVALPITITQRYSDTIHLYYTNGEIAADGNVRTWISNTRSFTVTQPGVQVLQVSKQHPLLLFDVDVALEWDASKEPRYLDQLQADLKETSRYLYDFSNGQVALGRVRISQDADNWGDAHIVVHATNRLRPYAAIGGAVFTDTLDFSPTIPITYSAGQIHIGSVWNRYGDVNPNPGIDWPLVLAHELSHYLLGLEDTYLGLDTPPEIGEPILVNVESCGSAMGDVYNPDNTEFVFDNSIWQSQCAKTLSNLELRRDEWHTIHGWFPWLVEPTQEIAGPNVQPFDFTTIQVLSPTTPTNVLLNQAFYLDYTGDVSSTSEARVFLLRDDNQDATLDYIYDLGNAIGDQKLLRAHGVQPGDQLCVFDRPRFQAGCESVREGDDHIQLFRQDDWRPVVQVSLVNSTTFNIQVINPASTSDFGLQARIFSEFGTETTISPLELKDGIYSGILKTNEPALAGHLYITSNDNNRRAIVAYNIGGNPGNTRHSGGGFSHVGGGNTRHSGGGGERGGGGNTRHSGGGDVQVGDAPAVSPDGKLIFFATEPLHLAVGQFYTVQDMAGLPSLPAGKIAIGQGYNLAATGFLTGSNSLAGSVSIQYEGLDVLTEKADESQLTIHFWNGQQWQALATHRDPKYNLASARSQGPGVYALLAGVTIPQITSLSPTITDNSQNRLLTITGTNFLAPLSVLLVAPTATYTLPVQSITTAQLTVLVTNTVLPNEYEVVVVNRNQPDGVARSTPGGRFSFFAANKDCFSDFFDSGSAKWTIAGEWGITSPTAGEQAMSDSPSGPYRDASDYVANQLVYTTSITSMPFSLAGCSDTPGLLFEHDYTLARSSLGDDQAIVEISTDDGKNWQELASYTGGGIFGNGLVESAQASSEWQDVQWKPVTISLQQYANAQQLRLRFSLQVNNDHLTSRGWIISKVRVGKVESSPSANEQHIFLPLIAR